MSGAPLVSVVMSVYNGLPSLGETLGSVLNQDDCDFEFNVINDGSRDGSGACLDEYARRDERLRVVHQENTGLTRALIRGCALAKGEFIARQDAGDFSLPGRLAEQAAFLSEHREVVAVASRIRFVAPDGEWLFDSESPANIEVTLDANSIKLPPLVGAMFRRDAYLRAGGFRPEFVVAQDVDLWLRLLEQGPCLGLAAAHYETRLNVSGISSRLRPEQLRFCALAVECAKRRTLGESDQSLLNTVAAAPRVNSSVTGKDKARFYYFVGACLHRNNRPAARRYYSRALSNNPFHIKALVRYLFGRR